VCARPHVLLAILTEDQERVDVERSVHQNAEVEPVGIGWLTDAEVVREAHAVSVSVTTSVPTKGARHRAAGCASKVGVRAAAHTRVTARWSRLC